MNLKKQLELTRWGTSILTWGWTIVVVLPLIFLVSVSLSADVNQNSFAFWIFPAHPTFENYTGAFEFMSALELPLPSIFVNSAIATGGAVIGSLIVSTLAAFAIVFLRLPGRRLWFNVICIGLVVPTSVMIIPEFLTVHRLGLEGRPALILPYIAFGLSLPTLLLTLFFGALPKYLIDAAVVDGVSTWQLLTRIVLPLSRPVLATVALLLFVTFWNEYPLALNLIRDTGQSTLPLAIANTNTRAGTPYPVVAAIMVMATIPVLAVLAFGQRQLVEGLTQGGAKE